MVDVKKVGNRLAELRGKRSQKDVATAIGVSISAIAMYETGQRTPRDEIKYKLARFYEKSIEELFFANNITHGDKTGIA
ncbi:MAG: helix-turn-helix transcriptional regulator [Oscillospiraceae bacterium]|jgi:transcriptional regulator with XRE-family HTH domain|nr:helix-turn-helix transcriptional regulator [Oscillospiraceae bacterium]